MPEYAHQRADERVKVKMPVELYLEGNAMPYRCATSDISLFGCYIETMFPFPVGSKLEIKLKADNTLLLLGTVVTSDPQVGNGIQFTKILPEDTEELRAFLEARRKEAAEKETPKE
jgi:hypothetical protein